MPRVVAMLAAASGRGGHLSFRDIAGCVFVLAAIVLGGGGSSAPFSELLSELAALLAAVFLFVLPQKSPASPLPRQAIALGALLLVLPVLQLIPLPPSLWQAMPGREAETAALGLVGRADSWMPWSLVPAATFASLLSLLPSLVALAYAVRAEPRGRSALIATAAIGGVLSLVLGALQLADGDGRTWRFYEDNPGFLDGFQANRNAEVDVLLVAALAAAAGVRLLVPSHVRLAIPLGATICAALLLGCILTGSRTGIALMVPTIVLVAMILDPRLGDRRPLRAAGLIVLGALAMIGIGVALRNQALLSVAERFTLQRDVRLDLWQDSWTAIRATWPWGSGVGTFKIAFLPFERLIVVDSTHPVRVHDEYLEFLFEGGAAALLVMLGGIALAVRAIMAACKKLRPGDVPQLAWALGTLAIAALHSCVDYPMRSMALTTLNAIAAGIVFAIAAGRNRDRPRGVETA